MTSKLSLSFSAINQAWMLHREEIETSKDGVCNIYVRKGYLRKSLKLGYRNYFPKAGDQGL